MFKPAANKLLKYCNTYFRILLPKAAYALYCSNMRRFILLLLITHCSLLIAQQPTEEWVARIPGPNNDLTGPFLQVDKNGNSYVAGTRVINDSINILVVKYNTLGVQQWITLYKYPGEGYFAPAGLALDSSGNAYVISRYGQGFTSPLNSLIIKFNSLNGSVIWARKYAGEYGWSSFLDIKIDRLDNIYCAGWSDTSHLVIRYNTNGDSVWVRKYHPPSSIPPQFVREVASACVIDDSLNIIFTGIRMHYYPPNGNLDSILVAKYSPSGVLRWESVHTNSLTGNEGKKITADQSGNLYIGGAMNVSGDGVYLTLKYDRNGNQQWAKIYDAPGGGSNNLTGIALDRNNNSVFVTGSAVTNSYQMATTIKYNTLTGDSLWVRKDTGTYKYGDARDIKIDTSGNLYITGVSSGTGSGAPVDILSIKYSQQGVRNWLVTYNGPFNGLDIGKDLELDNSNNVYVLGTSQSSSLISDYVLIKYNQSTGIKAVSNEIPFLYKLEQNYPNPFNSGTKFRFQNPKLSAVKVTVFDILGREVENPVNEMLKPGVYEIGVDGTNYSSGVYFYRMTADEIIVDTKKLVITK